MIEDIQRILSLKTLEELQDLINEDHTRSLPFNKGICYRTLFNLLNNQPYTKALIVENLIKILKLNYGCIILITNKTEKRIVDKKLYDKLSYNPDDI